MQSIDLISTEEAPTPIGPYSQAALVAPFLFCSGQIAIDAATGGLIEGGVSAETEKVIDNLEAVLESSGSSLPKVIKTTVYLRDIADIAAMNVVYERRFGSHRPARVTIQADGLPGGAQVEIDAIALL